MKIRRLSYFQQTHDLINSYFYFMNMIEDTKTIDEKFMRDVGEVRTRVEQLDYLYETIQRLNYETLINNQNFELERTEWEIKNDVKNNPDTPFPNELTELMNKCFDSMSDSFFIQLHFEQFYYVAGRIRNVVRHLPGIEKKFEAEGIRNIRNNIIEHPEKVDFSSNGFTYGISKGPTINTIGDNNIIYKDKGFFENAEEFKTNLESVLKKNITENEKIFTKKFINK